MKLLGILMAGFFVSIVIVLVMWAFYYTIWWLGHRGH